MTFFKRKKNEISSESIYKNKLLYLLSLFLITSFAIFFLSPVSYSQSLPQIQVPENVSRGSSLTITLPPQSIPIKSTATYQDVSIILNGSKIDSNRISFDTNKKFLSTVDFIIPDSASLGKTSARIDIKENNTVLKRITLPKPLNIVGSFGVLSPEVKAIAKVTFPNKNGLYSFSVIGKNFSIDNKNDNKLFLSKIKNEDGVFVEGKEEKICWQVKKSKECKNTVIGEVISSRELKFQEIPKDYAGEVGIQIGVGENTSDIYPAFLSPVSQEIPKHWSFNITILLIVLILLIAFSGRKKLGATQKSFSFLVEPENNTLSLSRLQFYVWTLTAILSYLYLLFSKSLIQNRFEFIDIPSGLPAIIFISATTTFLAQGITNTKGSKGAGEMKPQLSDLISIGGVAVPERLQFLVWTILGSLVFLFITFFQNPENIDDLPQIPQGFLQLMGVSSFGYLGGKFSRKAGPVLSEVSADYIGNSLILNLRGSGLSQDGICKVGSYVMTSTIIDGGKPKIMAPDDSNEPNFAKHLELSIENPDSDLKKNVEDINNKFQIMNPDRQIAEWKILLAVNQPSQDPSQNSLVPSLIKVVASYIDQSLIFDLQGTSLSQDATCTIGDYTIPSEIIKGGKPEIITQEDSSRPKFAKHLKITILDASDPSFKENNMKINKFLIRNPDGQNAESNISVA